MSDDRTLRHETPSSGERLKLSYIYNYSIISLEISMRWYIVDEAEAGVISESFSAATA